MQLIARGPDLPDTLLQAHEDGRVVFFCGAGISYPAGLPGFQGLVDSIYKHVGDRPTPVEQRAYEREQFDAVLDLLERRVPGHRLTVRNALSQVLRPNTRRKGATETHTALLDLARTRNGDVRLVTTNFDRIFERVAHRTRNPIARYCAPMLPIPKNSRWNGLVYLHGLLPETPDDSALNRLVLTSGDFGLAYLTERWASRFVGELFRHYVVCFVGYSISDPVLRYMMDALAADRMLGENTPEAFAFADSPADKDRERTIEWEAKGVVPILYEPSNGHAALHATLKAWARTWRDGILGKERIVVSYAIARPAASTKQDNFVGRMLWALSHPSGLPAKRFAEFNPAPSLDWLTAFDDKRYVHTDLPRFSVTPQARTDERLRYSLIHRPAPYNLAPSMGLVSAGASNSGWDDVMLHIAKWLTRHLNDPELLLWLAQRGGDLDIRFRSLIEVRLDELIRLELAGKTEEIREVLANSPNAVPVERMRLLWRLLLGGLVKSPGGSLGLFRWKDRVLREGVSSALRLEFRQLLAPRVAIRRAIRWRDDVVALDEDGRVRQAIDYELALAADHVQATLRDLSGERWDRALSELLDDLQQLVTDALDLLRDLGDASALSDRSHWDLPSISPHRQNRGFREWTVLIELLRDAWLVVLRSAPDRAAAIARRWFEKPYPTFKRLALFAASQPGIIGSHEWLAWLLSDESWWLWSIGTRRETMRLLVLRGMNLTPEAKSSLEAAILAGPPRRMYKDDLGEDEWREQVDDSVWRRLAKLRTSGAQLGPIASERLSALSRTLGRSEQSPDERNEFSHWISGTGDPDFEMHRVVNTAPRRRSQLVHWLRAKPPDRMSLQEDTWGQVCRSRLFHALFALCDLSQEGVWPVVRWTEALEVWSDAELARRAGRLAAVVLQRIPDAPLRDLSPALSSWIEASSKFGQTHDGILLELCRRILKLDQNETVDTDNPVTRAINHPIGRVTSALANIWLNRTPGDNDELPPDLKPTFSELCDTRNATFRHARVVLAAHLIALFRVDREWTEAHLLPLFDWSSCPTEARAAWEGFLWSPRLYAPLLLSFKQAFLATAAHYDQLGDHRKQFVAFLTYAALEPRLEGYSSQDFHLAFSVLPPDGLREAAYSLLQALEAAGDRRHEYWASRIAPLWHDAWPKSLSAAPAEISEPLALLAIAAGVAFPAALETVKGWLQPIQHAHHVVSELNDSGLCARFPLDALKLLDLISDEQDWPAVDLGKCLTEIQRAEPSLTQDRRYEQLLEYFRRRGIG